MIPSAGRAALGVLAALILAAAAAASPDTAGGISGAPLAPRAHPRGRTMFTQLSPDETGLRTENKYDDPKMWSSLYQEFEGGSIGTGVAIGDYDGDGRPDIFVVTKTHGCRLFRNLGIKKDATGEELPNFKYNAVGDRDRRRHPGNVCIDRRDASRFCFQGHRHPLSYALLSMYLI